MVSDTLLVTVDKLDKERLKHHAHQLYLQQRIDGQTKLVCEALQDAQRSLQQTQVSLYQHTSSWSAQDAVMSAACLMATLQIINLPVIQMALRGLQTTLVIHWPAFKHKKRYYIVQ